MRPKRFTDPIGSKLPALEQNILKHRAIEMLLVMFYAEELKRDVLSRVQTGKPERVPKGTKNAVDKALSALIADRAITVADKIEIVKLIDYRNVIGHQIHNLLLDMSPAPFARDMMTYLPDRLPKYDYEAVARLRHYLDLLDGLYRTHHYVVELNMDRHIFRAAEKTFVAESERLGRKISRLLKVRNAELKKLNAELSLEETELIDEYHPRHPLSHYDDGRLTKRGVEICYRLFDNDKSAMAVAHLTGLSLIAARKRRRMWDSLGGKDRTKVDLATIPHRKFYGQHDD
jgi:hypothetical protein